MAEMEKVEFEFPDEAEAKGKEEAPPAEELEAKSSPEIEIEIEDDTPPEDRGRKPLPKELVEKLEVDELDKYSLEAKEKLVQMKKVWHDERRRADSSDRERQAAIDAAQRLMEENKRIKDLLSNGEKEYVAAMKTAADLQLEMAKKSYKEAYEGGDSEGMMNAQQSITNATLQLDRIKNFKMPALQEEKNEVQIPQQAEKAPEPDRKATEWQENNLWFGQDEEMTATALGLHEKLKRNGVTIGSDEYYKRIDETMRKRFPEQFEEPEVEKPAAEPVRKPSNVVAPATRSTSSKRIRLTNTQVALAKKLGLTPEQYALEIKKLEALNG
ncbi:MAG: hypothetical protein EB120_09660 [Proteobacteria bacterium]|jgi:hypothetical protein|nr:hypothetical protein [Pseudomonadota bacterium]